MLPPTAKAKVGDPPLVFRVTTSLKVAVTLKVSPAFNVLFWLPVALLSAMLPTVEAKV